MAKNNDSKPAAKRGYLIGQNVRVDLNNPASVVSALRKAIGNEKATVADVFVHVAKGTGAQPKPALKAVAEKRPGMNGDYDVVAESAFSQHPVKSETKTVVSVG
jgi:hypothetical protein